MTENSTFSNSRKKSDHTNYLKIHNGTAELEISRHDPVENHHYIPPGHMAQDSGGVLNEEVKKPTHQKEVGAELKQHLLNNRGISSTLLKSA